MFVDILIYCKLKLIVVRWLRGRKDYEETYFCNDRCFSACFALILPLNYEDKVGSICVRNEADNNFFSYC